MIRTDAIFLDVDGTLWNSTPVVAVAWNRVLEEHGLATRVSAHRLTQLFGKPMDIIADELLPDLAPEARYALLKPILSAEEKAIRDNHKDISYPGVSEGIKKLSGRFAVCIVSNCQAGYIELVMDKLGIAPYIRDYESYGRTGLYKAENIRLVKERNHFRAPVYLGDIQGDQDASRAAGVAFIHAAYGFGTADAPDATVNSFAELESLLEPLENAAAGSTAGSAGN